MDKIDRDLLDLLSERERTHANAVARNDAAAMAVRDAPIQVRVAFDGSAESLQASGFPVYSVIPDVAHGGLSSAQIRALAARPEVHQISLPGVVCGRGRNPTLSRGHAFHSP